MKLRTSREVKRSTYQHSSRDFLVAMRRRKVHLAIVASLLLIFTLSGCSSEGDSAGFRIWRPKGFGVGGTYNEARNELRTGQISKAIRDLEYVVRKDPFYEDSLAQLGRAYYMAGRYEHAFQVLKRAVAAKPQDETGWIVLGLTQLRLGDDDQGVESFKAGITLFIKHSQDGYKDIEYIFWDTRGVVRRTVRRSVFLSRKGVEEKNKIIQIGELLLARIDRELYQADHDQLENKYETGPND